MRLGACWRFDLLVTVVVLMIHPLEAMSLPYEFVQHVAAGPSSPALRGFSLSLSDAIEVLTKRRKSALFRTFIMKNRTKSE